MQNDGPLVSVIIPCYNAAEYLEETLVSLFNQTFQNFEVIAIDDGSTDDTLSLLQRLSEQHPKFQVLTQKNTYYIIARKNAIAHAKGKYLVCLDSDDKLAPEYLEKCVTVAESNPEIAIVYSDAVIFDRENKPWDLPDFKIRSFLLSNCIYVTALIRKSSFDAVGGFDISLTMFEDWELFISLIQQGAEVHRIREPLFFYRQRANLSSVSNQANKEKRSENLFRIYSKHRLFYEKNGIYFQDLFSAKFKNEQYYQRWWRRYFYKYCKPKRYQQIYINSL